jgi:hypothetical protein
MILLQLSNQRLCCKSNGCDVVVASLRNASLVENKRSILDRLHGKGLRRHSQCTVFGLPAVSCVSFLTSGTLASLHVHGVICCLQIMCSCARLQGLLTALLMQYLRPPPSIPSNSTAAAKSTVWSVASVGAEAKQSPTTLSWELFVVAQDTEVADAGVASTGGLLG